MRFFLFLVVLISITFAETITLTFENNSAPGFNAVEGTTISNQFAASHGVTFSSASAFPVTLVEVGDPFIGFASAAGSDQLIAGQPDVGSFFIGSGAVGSFAQPFDFTMTLLTPASEISGLVFDIERPIETVIFEILDINGQVLESFSTDNAVVAGDGIASSFAFSRNSDDIFALRMQGFRDGGGLIGTGIDNLTITRTTVPEPQVWISFLLMLLFVVTVKHKRS